MILEKYDKQAHMRMLSDEAYKEGRQAGIEEARLEYEQIRLKDHVKIKVLEEKLRHYESE